MAMAWRPMAMSGLLVTLGELQRVLDPADRADRVSDPDEPGFAVDARHRRLEPLCEREVLVSFPIRLVGLTTTLDRHHHANGVRHERLVARADETVHVQERRDRPRGVGPTAKAEEIELVASG